MSNFKYGRYRDPKTGKEYDVSPAGKSFGREQVDVSDVPAKIDKYGIEEGWLLTVEDFKRMNLEFVG